MSNRAREFLDRWKLNHVGEVPSERRLQEIVRLVANCRADAVSAGIPPEELREAAGNSLILAIIAAQPAAGEENETAMGSSVNQVANGTPKKVWQRLVSQVLPAMGA